MIKVFSYIFVFVLGISLGSFLNALEYRLYKKISIFDKWSKCPKCSKHIKAYDNIPVLSFILLRAKCRFCKKSISWQYPLVELWVGLSFVFVFWFRAGSITEIVRDLVVVWVLSFIFIYDLKYMEVLDSITLPAAAFIFLLNINHQIYTWQNMLLAAFVAGGFFLAQYVISNGRWIGGGDIRIGILMGVVLGWPNVVFGLGLAYIIGAVSSVFLLSLKKKKMTDQIAFGTYLTIATFVALFWGGRVVDWYLGLLS